MVIDKFECTKCARQYDNKDRALVHEATPISHDDFPSGYCYKASGAVMPDYAILASKGTLSEEHIRSYQVIFIDGGALDPKRIKFRDTKDVLMQTESGDCISIENITDREFAKVKDRLARIAHWDTFYVTELTNKKVA